MTGRYARKALLGAPAIKTFVDKVRALCVR